jgi:hypothetical protein
MSDLPLTGSTAVADPGGMFGWLIFQDLKNKVPRREILTIHISEYSDPNRLVNDINALNGCTSCIVSTVMGGITYTFSRNNGDDTLKGLTNGNNFLLALNYLSCRW